MPPKRRVSGEKRPKGFTGTPYRLVKARAENSGGQNQQSESEEEQEYVVPSASKRKLLGLSDGVENSEEFNAWFEWHKDECTLNHSGSSSAMEVGGALVLWKRSIEYLNFRYVNVVIDGDSKAISSVQKAKLYGDDCPVMKYECVGHVQKRVGAAMIKLKRNPPTEMVEVVVEKAVKAHKATKIALPLRLSPLSQRQWHAKYGSVALVELRKENIRNCSNTMAMPYVSTQVTWRV